ncbi:MAG: trehalose-phosphatase [Rhodanobacter sp.]
MSTSFVVTPSTHPPLPAPPLPCADAHWAILLDVDGTLLDFADDPRAVRVSPTLLRLLHAMHTATQGALALVSGRAIDDLDQLFEHPHWATIGLHGLQLRHANGGFRRLNVPHAQQTRMHQQAQALAARFAGVQLEDKQSAVALHCRQAPDQLDRLREAASAVAAQLPGYELQPGHEVVEFKPAGMDKGRAVTELLQRAPFMGRTPIYMGDDLTDEHAFVAVNRRHGISVRVGAREPSAAHFTLANPGATEAWLARVLRALTH